MTSSDARCAELESALRKLITAGRAYMDYHARNFYDGADPPSGLTPLLDEAEGVLEGRADG